MPGPSSEQLEGVEFFHYNPREECWIGWLDRRMIRWNSDHWMYLEGASSLFGKFYSYCIGGDQYQVDTETLAVSILQDREWENVTRPKALQPENQKFYRSRDALVEALTLRMTRLGVPPSRQKAKIREAAIALNKIWGAPLGEGPKFEGVWEHLLDED